MSELIKEKSVSRYLRIFDKSQTRVYSKTDRNSDGKAGMSVDV